MQSSTAHPVACLNNLLCDQSRCCFIIIAHTQRDAVEGERHLANGFGVERLTDKIMSRLPLSALSAMLCSFEINLSSNFQTHIAKAAGDQNCHWQRHEPSDYDPPKHRNCSPAPASTIVPAMPKVTMRGYDRRLQSFRLVKRAFPRPVPMVKTPHRETSCMNGISLSP